VLTKDEKLARLKIIRSESIGPTTFWSIIKLYGTGMKALQAIPQLTKSSAKPFKLCNDEKIDNEIKKLKSIGARLIFFEDELYPPLLRNIPDPPPVLTFLGNKEKTLSFYQKNIISVVGSRNSSIHANRLCTSMCKDLGAKDTVIVSGFARGIDTCAHASSLETGTIAILAGGINVIYPAENTKLYDEISKNAGLFTETPFGATPQPQLFPRRNRIIAGISYGTLVVEAALNSGSLITAKIALEYNREVYAIPGFPLDPRSEGCNFLIKEGAILVQNSDDILSNIDGRKIIRQPLSRENTIFAEKIANRDLEKTRKKILNSLNSVPITIDELISCIKVSPQEVLTVLLELELSGRIVRLHGQRVCLSLNA
jgi:DNA processing protein